MPDTLTDAELADIRDQEQWTSPWRDVPRLLATIAELKAVLADCQQDSLAYLAGVREGRRQAMEEERERHPPDYLLDQLDW